MKSAPRCRFRLIPVATAIAICLSAANGQASVQDDAADVKDKPLNKVERKLSGRGYEIVESSARGDYQYWWNRDQDRCLELRLKNDRVSRAEPRDEKTCRDAGKHSQSHASQAPAHGSPGMVGMRASSLDSEMARRGFTDAGGYKDNDTSYTTWWNRSTRECLSVATRDGRVDNVRSVAEGNCR